MNYVTAVIRSSKIDRDGQMQIVFEIPYTQIQEAREIASLVQQNLHLTVITDREFRRNKDFMKEAGHGQGSGTEAGDDQGDGDQSGPV